MRAGGWLAGVLAGLLVQPVAAVDLAGHPQLSAVAGELVTDGTYSADEIVHLLGAAQTDPRVLEALTRPAEAMPWSRYRPIFMTEARIEAGAAFWDRNAAILRRAEEAFGVPASIIVAIIGVETNYGTQTGRYRVLDALATLGLSEHPRAGFFLSELGHFLRLVREEDLDPLTLTGSYAGAMGISQFISSSYRHYAVDFDGDGRRDLMASVADAIGSVGSYLSVHGWAARTPIALPVQFSGDAAPLLADGVALKRTVRELAEAGAADLPEGVEPTAAAFLLRLDGTQGDEYFVAFKNFYAITRYNRSPLYAMAVTELAQAVTARRGSGG